MTKSVLLISYFAPCRGHAGGLRLLELYQQIKLLSPNIHLELIACIHPDADWGLELIETIFNKVYWVSHKQYSIETISSMGAFDRAFDFIDLQYHQSGALIPELKQRYPRAIITFSPMESMVRAAILSFQMGWRSYNVKRICLSMWLALQEIYYVMRADRVTCVSMPDRESLLKFKKATDIFCVPTGLTLTIQNSDQHKYRENIIKVNNVLVFSAFFGSKTNQDSLIWFITLVHPLIKKCVPNYTLKVVGRGASNDLVKLCQADGVVFVGEVVAIEPEFESACIGIAPALSGAGVRGKINQYASVGLPCVATHMAAVGLKYESQKSILLADMPTNFANHCVMLLLDEKLRISIGLEAQRVCLENYTWQSMVFEITKAYNLKH